VNLSVETYGHAVLFGLKGELTADTLVAFTKAVEHHLLSRDDVIDLVLNLDEVTFIDSAAMEYLLDIQGQLAERLGQVKLVKPDENLRKILEITRLESTFETYNDPLEAVKAVHP
jgi:anti-anti-sigma factor